MQIHLYLYKRKINIMLHRNELFNFVFSIAVILTACSNDNEVKPIAKDPDKAEIVVIDRFSDAAVLMKRSADSNMPAANAPINFDEAPFKTQSLGPDGQVVRYYNFDVQTLLPAPIYVLVKGANNTPVEGQLNIIDVIPGEEKYSDFWQIYFVTVPDNYLSNSISSYNEIIDKGYSIEKQSAIVNCPVVPYGSTANENVFGATNSLHRGWYKGKVVYYFTYDEKELHADNLGLTPVSPIYVTFNINPNETNPESGPPSGFVMETGGLQTHNVIETIPSDDDYSPLWSVYIYDNADFDNVSDLNTVKAANILMENAMYVNCPVVYVAK